MEPILKQPLEAYSWLALAFTWALVFLSAGSNSSAAPILTLIRDDLDFGHVQAGILLSSPVTAVVFLAPMGGTLTDRIGVRRSVALGVGIAGVANLLKGFSPNFETLVALTYITGVGSGLMLPSLPKLIRGWFPQNLLGTITGIYATGLQAGFTASLALTIPVFLPLVQDWRGVFLVWGMITMLVFTLWILLGRGPPVQTAFTSKPENMPEIKHYSIWKEKSVLAAGVLLFLNGLVFTTLVQWLPTYFIEQGLETQLASGTASILTTVAIPTVFFVPMLSDRVGARKPFLFLASLVIASAAFMFLILPASLIWFPIAIFGISLNSQFVLVYVLMAEITSMRFLGRAAGIIMSFSFLGGVVGPIVVGIVREVTGGFNFVFVFFMSVSLASTGLILLIRETGVKRKNTKISIEQ